MSKSVSDRRSPDRRRAFVAAARHAFLNNGFAGTTMSSIVTEVGGSKTTLWTYFPSKDVLFAAVVDDIVEAHGKALSVPLPPDAPVRVVLESFAHALLESILSPSVLALHRLVAGEGERFPHIARLFYDRGPRLGKRRLAKYIAIQMDRGMLRKGDADVAGRQLVGLCEAGFFHRVLFGMDPLPSPPARRAEAEAAVDSFLRAWGTFSEHG